MSLTSKSKFLSLVLRHKPEEIGLSLDDHGWARVSELLAKAAAHGTVISPQLLEEIVATNDKKRFSFNDDKTLIRANQGHSIEVDLQLTVQTPPAMLYHGTATRFLDSIKQQGLIAGQRQYVHLSADEQVAIKVGQRHGKVVVLTIDTVAMQQAGLNFYLAENGVWLTEKVPVEFLQGL